ncbi:hypothetical protein [Nonomuraea sp. NPDC049158]|uniref:hypothetical protein n=1 Tax=Nonomuraea sp. NPDC049158 TaxID=3155649 RepID=UPI0033D28238
MDSSDDVGLRRRRVAEEQSGTFDRFDAAAAEDVFAELESLVDKGMIRGYGWSSSVAR